MARTGLASFRAAEDNFEMTFAQVTSRAHLVAQNGDTDWGKIKTKFTQGEVRKMSALNNEDEATALGRRLLDEMELNEALAGTATRDKKCPFFFFNFMMAAGRPVISADAEPPEQVKVFNMFDEECFIAVDQPLVSRAAMELKMIGAVPSQLYPSPIRIEDALSNRQGEHFVQWKSESNQFPRAIADRLWTESIEKIREVAA